MKRLIESFVKIIDPLNNNGRKVFIGRPIRVKIQKDHEIKLLINNEEILIENINSGGLGLALSAFKTQPVPAEKISATLLIANETFPIEIQIIYVNNTVGCKILNIKREVVNKIETYFQFEILGNSLTRIKSEKLKPDPDGTPISFFGSEQFELNLVVDKQKLIKFNLTFFDKYIELSKDQVLRIGTIKVDDEKSPFEYKKSNIIDFDNSELSEVDLKNINKILLNINSLDREIYQQIIFHFTTL